MSEMFGAPAGISAAEQDQQRSLLTGLQSMKLLGDIEQQPSERALKDAHARLYSAEAAGKEAEALQDRVMGQFMLGGGPGVDETGVSQIGTSGSLADPLFAMSRFAYGKGFAKKGAELYTKAVDIAAKEVVMGANQASQELREIRAQQVRLEQQANAAAGVTDQASYDIWRLAQAQAGEPVDSLPEDYTQAKPFLDQVVASGTSAKDQLTARQRAILDNAQTKALDARVAAANASAAAARARVRSINQVIELRKKNGGDVSEASRDLKRARTEAVREGRETLRVRQEAQAAAQASRDRKNASTLEGNAVTDPSKRIVGQAYRLPGGVYTWSKDGWISLSPNRNISLPSTGGSDDDDDTLLDETGE